MPKWAWLGDSQIPPAFQLSAFGQGVHEAGCPEEAHDRVGTRIMNTGRQAGAVSMRHLSCAQRPFRSTEPGWEESVAAHPLHTGSRGRDTAAGSLRLTWKGKGLLVLSVHVSLEPAGWGSQVLQAGRVTGRDVGLCEIVV